MESPSQACNKLETGATIVSGDNWRVLRLQSTQPATPKVPNVPPRRNPGERF